jgi:hypothetical protein
MYTLANLLSSRFKRIGDLDNLHQAISMAEKSVNAFPPGHPNRAIGMYKLTTLLGLRIDRIGDLDDLKRSILLAKEALPRSPSSSNRHEQPGQQAAFEIPAYRRLSRPGSGDSVG